MARVGIKGFLGPYDAEVFNDAEHDGILIARFDEATVHRIGRQSQEAGPSWPYRIRMADGIAEIHSAAPGSRAGPADLYEADDSGRYWIGAYQWPWEERPYYGPTARLASASQVLALRALGPESSNRQAQACAVLADWLADLQRRMDDPSMPYIPPLELRLGHALAELHVSD